MMHVVISGVVRCDMLQRIPWESISAVVVDSLYSRASKEPHTLPNGHACHQISQASTERVQQKPLNWMVIERAESVGHIKSMMARVQGSVQPFVHVHRAMQEVLPSINDKDCNEELHSGNDERVDRFRGEKLPVLESRSCS